MSLGKKAILNTGAKIPTLGYGTWQSKPGEVGNGVYEALKAGYRHLDLAKIYNNQVEVGKGIKRAFDEIPNLQRSDVFITSKLWNTQHHPEDVEAALDDCLQELGLHYLDLYLIHWPVAYKRGEKLFPLVPGKNEPDGDVDIVEDVSIIDTWKAMIKLPKEKARAVGVSNFNINHLEAIIKATGQAPSALQIERHPRLPNPPLMDFCAKHNIHVTAYSAFGNNAFNEPLLITHPTVLAAADKASKRLNQEVTGAQVVLAWSQVGNHSVIPKSVTPSRIRANFQEIELSDEEIAMVDEIGKKEPYRFNVPYVANKPRWNIDCFGDDKEKAAEHHVVVGA